MIKVYLSIYSETSQSYTQIEDRLETIFDNGKWKVYTLRQGSDEPKFYGEDENYLNKAILNYLADRLGVNND